MFQIKVVAPTKLNIQYYQAFTSYSFLSEVTTKYQNKLHEWSVKCIQLSCAVQTENCIAINFYSELHIFEILSHHFFHIHF
jgi:hypothetical protein